MNKLFERPKVLKLTQEEVDNPNSPIVIKVIKCIVKIFPKQKTLGSDYFIGKFYQKLNKKAMPIVNKLF
jgi:hypothetical protein